MNILIAEDEQLVREALKSLIDWEGNGLHIVGDAYNGAEALRIIEKAHVDILLTDIRMPVMDGLDLIRTVKERYPEIAAVVLSCYDEFHIVSKAFKLGAADYILKSEMNPADVAGVIKKVAEGIERRKRGETEAAPQGSEAGNAAFPQDSVSADRNSNLVAKVKNYIYRNYAGEITLSRLAAEFEVNYSYLSGVFKRQEGSSFLEYLNRVRIEKARELLVGTNLKVYEVAEKVGYVNIEHFSRKFKKTVGVCPKRYTGE